MSSLQVADFWQLGLDPIAVSAISGTGTGDLMEQLVALLPPPKEAEAIDKDDKALAVAIVGRPNVGKSSILNSLVSQPSSWELQVSEQMIADLSANAEI